MAADNEELARISEQVAWELDRFGKVSAGTADAFRDAQVGVKGFSDAVRTAPKAVGSAATDLAKAMYKGEKGAQAFNKSIDGMAQAADAAITVLSALIPGGPIVKAVVAGLGLLAKAVVKTAAETTKLANEQGDSLYKSFQGLAKSGLAASGGTTQLGKDLYKLGVSVYDADKTLSMMGEHSQDLALFGKTAFQGADAFTDIVNASKPYRAELERLGLNQHEQNEAIMQYIKTQTRMGNSTRLLAMGQDAAAAAANKYIDEQDAMTKLLGISRKEQQKAIDDAMRNARYAANLDEMIAENKTEEADQLNTLVTIARSVGGDFEKAIQDWTSGLVGSTDEAKKGIVSGGHEMFRLIQRIKQGEFKGRPDALAEAFQKAAGPMNEMTKNTRTLTKAVGDSGAMLNYGSRRNLDLLTNNNRKMAEAYAAARRQVEKQRAGEDTRLANQSETVVAQEDATLAAQQLVDMGIDPAAAAMAQVAKAALAAANSLNKMAGVKTPAAPAKPGGMAPGSGPAAQTAQMASAQKALSDEKDLQAKREQQKSVLDAKLTQLKADKETALRTGKSNEEIAKIDADIVDTEKQRKDLAAEIKTSNAKLVVLQRDLNIATAQQNSAVRDYTESKKEVTRWEDKVAAARKAQYELETGQNKEYNSVKDRIIEAEKQLAKPQTDSARARIEATLLALKKEEAALLENVNKELRNAQGGLQKAQESSKALEQKVAGPAAAGPEMKGDSKEFYNKMYSTLLEQAKKQGVANPEAIARLGAAQSSLETGYGKSTAAGNNYFGIKSKPGDANASMVDTQEWDPKQGKYVTIKAGFRKYANMEESAADYIKFLQENQRYRGVLAAQTAEQAIERQGQTGYATDPRYAEKLAAIHARGVRSQQAETTTAQQKPKTPEATPVAETRPVPATGAPPVPETKAAEGAVISGPLDGYKPNLLAHGTEAIIPIKDGAVPVNFTSDIGKEIKSALADLIPRVQPTEQRPGLEEAILSALYDMIQTQKETNAISQKILRANM